MITHICACMFAMFTGATVASVGRGVQFLYTCSARLSLWRGWLVHSQGFLNPRDGVLHGAVSPISAVIVFMYNGLLLQIELADGVPPRVKPRPNRIQLRVCSDFRDLERW